jgi:hypothetical protein
MPPTIANAMAWSVVIGLKDCGWRTGRGNHAPPDARGTTM